MLGIIDKFDKDSRVFCVKDNRIKATLLTLVRYNVMIVDDLNLNSYNSKRKKIKYFADCNIFRKIFRICRKFFRFSENFSEFSEKFSEFLK